MVLRRKPKYVNTLRRVRIAFIVFLLVHMVLLIERAVIDALGGLYLLLMLNAITCLMTIAGISGVKMYHDKLLLMYIAWVILWLAFNIFVILIYAETFSLSDDNSPWLSFSHNGKSWFEDNNFTCKKHDINSTTIVSSNTTIYDDIDCILKYEHIEIIQGALQILISLINFGFGVCMLVKLRQEENEDNFSFIGGSGNPNQRASVKIRYIREGYDVW